MCKGTKKNPCLAALTNDPKFQMNLKDCVQRIFIGLRQTNWKAASIPTDLKDPIGKISNLMEKAVLYTGTELVQFSFYFSSGQKYRVVSECSGFGIDYKEHQIVFAKEELTIIIDSIENDFLPQFSKNGNTANIPRKVKRLSQMLSRYLKVLSKGFASICLQGGEERH